jgi:hypothetical protein
MRHCANCVSPVPTNGDTPDLEQNDVRSGTKIGLLAAANLFAALWTFPVEAGLIMTISQTDGQTTVSGNGVPLIPALLEYLGPLGNSMLDLSSAVEIVSPTDVYADLST